MKEPRDIEAMLQGILKGKDSAVCACHQEYFRDLIRRIEAGESAVILVGNSSAPTDYFLMGGASEALRLCTNGIRAITRNHMEERK